MTIIFEIKKIAINCYKNKSLTIKEITKNFNICKSSLYNWIKMDNIKPKRIRKPKIEIHIKFQIRDYVIRRPNFNYKLLLK